jgi:O-antigen/teichoic acid export membrane protein
MKPSPGTALRDFLLVVAIIAAVIAGAALVSVFGLLFRTNPISMDMMAPAGVAVAIIAASMSLRAIVQPRLHRERVAARSETWIEWATIAIFFSTAMVTFTGAAAFHWPAWLTAIVAILMLLIGLLALARRAGKTKAATDDLCPTCGYDVRGLPEPRCPECGARLDSKD